MTGAEAVFVRVLASADADAEGKVLALAPGAPLVIGRAPGGDGLALADPRASRRHAELRCDEDGRLVLTDLASVNGTFVDRARLDGALRLPGDAVVRVGDTTLHAGPGFEAEDRPVGTVDRRIALCARSFASRPDALAILAAPGAGTRTLARELHRRSGRPGPLHLVGPQEWSRNDPAAVLPAEPGSTVLLRGADDLDAAALAALLERAERRDVRCLLHVDRTLGALDRAVRRDARVTLPAPRRRRAAVWGLTQAMLGVRLGASPRWSAGAAEAWLSAPLDGGFTELVQRLARIDVLPGEELRTRDLRLALEPARSGWTPPERKRSRPTREALIALLKEHGQITRVAAALERPRRQVYRWMEALDVQRGRDW